MATAGNLKKVLANVRERQSLIVTPRLDRYLIENGGDVTIPEEIADRIWQELVKTQRDRTQAWSASAADTCPRRQQFSYLGVVQKRGADSRLAQIFRDGTYRHLRWQATLLHAGIIDSIEGFKHDEVNNQKGSMDGEGTVPDENDKYAGLRFGFELKGINEWGFKSTVEEGPKPYHIRQIHRYFLMHEDLDVFSLIYENKNTNEWREEIVERDDNIIDEVQAELDELNRLTKHHQLADVRQDCLAQSGEFKRCPYAWMCLLATKWEHVEKFDADHYDPSKPIKTKRAKGRRRAPIR